VDHHFISNVLIGREAPAILAGAVQAFLIRVGIVAPKGVFAHPPWDASGLLACFPMMPQGPHTVLRGKPVDAFLHRPDPSVLPPGERDVLLFTRLQCTIVQPACIFHHDAYEVPFE
jgi:hypothetical protein